MVSLHTPHGIRLFCCGEGSPRPSSTASASIIVVATRVKSATSYAVVASGKSLCACRTFSVKIALSARLEAFKVLRICASRGPNIMCCRAECEAGFEHVIVVVPFLP